MITKIRVEASGEKNFVTFDDAQAETRHDRPMIGHASDHPTANTR